jgi:Peptidase M50B-like
VVVNRARVAGEGVVKRTIASCLGFGCVMAALQVQNYIAALMVIAGLAFLLLRARVTTATGYATVRGHSHDGPIRQVAIHEGGHAAAANLVGGRVLDARVSGNDRRASGYTEVVIPNDPASQIGVYLAGFAAAPGTSSTTDQPLVDEVLAQVPSPYRGHVLREGQKIAHRAAGSSDVQHYAKRLERRGRL